MKQNEKNISSLKISSTAVTSVKKSKKAFYKQNKAEQVP